MSGKGFDEQFVDTNILLYAHDRDAGRKHQAASSLLGQLWASGSGILSMQVLMEFYVNSTRKMAKPLTPLQARTVVETYLPWCVEPSVADIAAAFQIEQDARINFWDAMIVAAAARSGATRLFSEDLNHNQRIAGVLVVNPFVG